MTGGRRYVLKIEQVEDKKERRDLYIKKKIDVVKNAYELFRSSRRCERNTLQPNL